MLYNSYNFFMEYYSNIFEKHHISFYRLKIIKFIELYCIITLITLIQQIKKQTNC